ncbi:MAG: UDP-N-acetylmuramate--L-alanine ligase [Bdellovibrionota bacterium]
MKFNNKSSTRLNQIKFHFVGIGGIGMCGLAELFHTMGAPVSGSDIGENGNTQRLKSLGIKVQIGHKAENVTGADVVVFSSAISFGNPEMMEARSLGIPLIPRAEALAEIMRLKRGIAIAGTHGKTTTTSLVASAFLANNMNPTIVVGGRFDRINSTAKLGDGEWLIAEADESDGSFQKLTPEISIITNVDSDHLDYYKSFENLQKAFIEFANRIPFYGKCIVCGDDAQTRSLFDNFSKKMIFYGFDSKNDYILEKVKDAYQITEHDPIAKENTVVGSFKLQLPGRHYALNALAAVLAANAAGIEWKDACKGVETFEGVDRRFQFKGEAKGISIYDDYGHHPTEVRVTLEAFREKFPDRRIVVLFQPHRYSRTETCWHEFTQCFTLADKVILTDIYAAGENSIPGITGKRLVEDIKHKDKTYVPRQGAIHEQIFADLKKGDVFLTLGAGDGWKIGMEILDLCKK